MPMCMASRKRYTQIYIGSIAEHEIFHIHAVADTDYVCLWHHVVCRPNCIRLCMTMYSMHILVAFDPWITGSFSLLSLHTSLFWKSHLYYTCTKCVCVLYTSRDSKAEFWGSLYLGKLCSCFTSQLTYLTIDFSM